MSPQIIPLKGRKICGDPAEFWLWRLFASDCGVGDTQLGTGFCQDLQQTFCTDVGHHAASPRRHELAAISFDQKMIRRRQNQRHHCAVRMRDLAPDGEESAPNVHVVNETPM
jgi:hypothetical protein